MTLPRILGNSRLLLAHSGALAALRYIYHGICIAVISYRSNLRRSA